MFLRNSYESIVKDFTKAVAKLHALADQHEQKSEALVNQQLQLAQKAADSQKLASKARKTALNIGSLIG